ncbi:MAG: helix-turn-helix domain-containing protein, partial [Nanoarchaeota archaeon]
ISRDLKIPANTVNYNVKKLLKAGLIEKSKNYFWSVKGKKIVIYRAANKKIVISPKSSKYAKQLLLTLGLTGVLSLLIRNYYSQPVISETYGALKDNSDVGQEAARVVFDNIDVSQNIFAADVWLWFLLGAIVALTIFMILNWRNKKWN